ncbi:glycosyl transferase [Nocardioides sp. Soil797]|nr:glycosyl transferase [Nocardioides sp. Soil797]
MVDRPPVPSVGVVVATHNRPALMRKALESILAQDHPGLIEVVLVFDRSEPDATLERSEDGRRVRVLTNNRSPGLAGARNTGILALKTDIVAFCDDDDTWLQGKLTAQLGRLTDSPAAEFVTTAMRVNMEGQITVRQAGRTQVDLQDFIRSRMAMLHSSSFLFRRDAMLDGFGLVDEAIPNSMGEDWDLLMRAARRQPIEHVDEPLIDVLWGATSYFNDVWQDKNAAHLWLLEKHPEMSRDKIGAAMMLGKLAFGHAAMGNRREALRFVGKCMRTRVREPRSVLALLVVCGVPAGWVQERLNRLGHGV